MEYPQSIFPFFPDMTSYQGGGCTLLSTYPAWALRPGTALHPCGPTSPRRWVFPARQQHGDELIHPHEVLDKPPTHPRQAAMHSHLSGQSANGELKQNVREQRPTIHS